MQVGVHLQCVGILQLSLAFTSRSVSHRRGIRAFSGLFWGFAQPCTHAWLSQFPGMCQSFPKMTSGHVAFQIFGQFLLYSNWYHHLRQLKLLNNFWFFWKKYPGIGISSLTTWDRSNKDKTREWDFPRELPDRSDDSPRTRLRGELQTHLLPPTGTGFHSHVAFKAADVQSWGEGDGNRANLNATELTVLKNQSFFWQHFG